MIKKINMLLPLGFFIIILVGLVSHILIPDKSSSDMENRWFQRAPLQPTKAELLSGDWSAEIEAYFSDQFPGRQTWLKTYVQSEMAIGKNYINEKYYADKETGWITSKPAELQSEETLKIAVEKVASLKSLHDALGIQFSFISLPAKATYVREPHPAYMPKDSGIESNGKFLALLEAENIESVRLIDEMRNVNNGKLDAHDWYFKTDHHWNMDGAFVGYQAIVRELSNQIAEPIIPMSFENTETSCLENDFIGTWNKFFSMLIPSDDKICYQEPAQFDDSFTVYEGTVSPENEVKWSEVYATGRNLPGNPAINYSVGYSSDYGELNIVNDRYNVAGHLLVFKDSYFNPIQFHVASHFKKTTIIDLRYFNNDINEYVKTLQPAYTIMTYNDRNFEMGF